MPQEDTRCDHASTQAWIKLIGPAAGLLKESFCAPNVIFFQDVPGERSNAEQEKIQEDKSETECVRVLTVAPVSGGGCVHGTEKGTTEGVKPETGKAVLIISSAAFNLIIFNPQRLICIHLICFPLVRQTRIVIPGTAGTQRHIIGNST